MRTLIKKANITADKVARKSDWAWALEQGAYRNGQTYYAVVLYNPATEEVAMGRRRGVIYVHGDAYCHCPDPVGCGETHAADDGVLNDDIAAFQVRVDLKRDSAADELYHSVDDLMADLTDTMCEPGDAWVVDLATGNAHDAAEFRDDHL